MIRRLVLRSGPGVAAGDAAALLVFVLVGLLSHHGGVSATGLARDGLSFVGCWLVAGVAFGLYAHPSPRRLLATWVVAVPVAVLIRAVVLGRSPNGKEAGFLAVALTFTLLFVVALRLVVGLVSARTGRPEVGRARPRVDT